jgi:hypothetical protein
MGINLKEYSDFLNESMDIKTAIENLVEIVQKSAGWISPKKAIGIFLNLTGLEEDDFEVDKMLGTLMDLDLLYYEDKTVSNGKGKKVELEDPEVFVRPERSSDLEMPQKVTESFKIKRLDEFY